jgi:hypothetical protein
MVHDCSLDKQVDNLADLFAKSLFRGLDMGFDDKDMGRDISPVRVAWAT